MPLLPACGMSSRCCGGLARARSTVICEWQKDDSSERWPGRPPYGRGRHTDDTRAQLRRRRGNMTRTRAESNWNTPYGRVRTAADIKEAMVDASTTSAVDGSLRWLFTLG